MNQEIYISKTMTWELHLKIFCIGLLVITTLLCRLIYVSVWVGRPFPLLVFFFLPFPQNREPVQRLRFFNTTDALSVTFWLPSVTRERWEGGWGGAGCHVYKNQVH